MFFKKWKIRRMENRRQTEVRKRLFTWIFRYLRLHSELLEDPIYKEMYDYHRARSLHISSAIIKTKKSPTRSGVNWLTYLRIFSINLPPIG